MTKNFIAFFFMFLIIGVILAPVIIDAIDDNADKSFLYECAEEEKETEKNNIFELICSEFNSESESPVNVISKSSTNHQFLNYSKPNLHIISPPPEFI